VLLVSDLAPEELLNRLLTEVSPHLSRRPFQSLRAYRESRVVTDELCLDLLIRVVSGEARPGLHKAQLRVVFVKRLLQLCLDHQ